MQIKKAERKAVKIKLAITGPSGAGKTMGGLLLAKGLADGGKVLVIDSEDGSSNLYADHRLVGLDFDVIEIEAPYSIDKYLEALKAGQDAGYEVIVMDSISHAWDAEGGLQDKKHALDMRGGNSFTNWRSITKEHELFKAKIVHSPCHIIATMRSKQEYIIEANDKGKTMPRKVGLAPVQRDGMEYEFTTVFDVAMDHKFSVSKDRTSLFDGRIEHITEKTGQEIKQWLQSGKEMALEAPKAASAQLINLDQETEIADLMNESKADVNAFLKAYGITCYAHLTQEQYLEARRKLKKKIEDSRRGA
jgi:hypothetical protein